MNPDRYGDNKLSTSAKYLLACWQLECVSTKEMAVWADAKIAALEVESIPSWLISISLEKPEDAIAELNPPELSFSEIFIAFLERTDSTDTAAVEHLAFWARSKCLGQDLSNYEVQIGYDIDEAFDNFQPELAYSIIRDAIKNLVRPGPIELILKGASL